MLIIKVGGGTAINRTGIAQDIKKLKQPVVFVHGGRRQTDELAEKLGTPTKRITSPSGLESVLTDRKALELMLMAYSGLINKQWIEVFQHAGLNAIGLSGADGQLWQGRRKQHLVAQIGKREKLISDTWTGKVETVNTKLIKLLLVNGYLPVITQPAISDQGELINTDNDRNLAVMAKALQVKKIVVLFEAPGMLKNPHNPNSLIKAIKKAELENFMPYAQGTMKKKLLGAIEAFKVGVKTIYWGDSRIENPIKNALAGKGTIIT